MSVLPTTESYLRSPNNGALVDSFVDRAGKATTYGYDGALRPVRVTNSLEGVTVNAFDPLGSVASQTGMGSLGSEGLDWIDSQRPAHG